MFYLSPKQRYAKCAIYRGAGGAGDATNDAASEVLLALAAKDAAIAAQAAAEAAQVAAETAQAAAELAETNAETAETNAETAETNAETAETNAETAQAAAEAAQTAAEAAQTAAETAETNAAASASAASTSASNASTSATNASNSASSASTSATNASNSASAAASSATTASNAATAAQTAQTAAELAETNAETAETNAETAETNAAASASAASTSATNASNSASAASTSATNASNSASAASTSASNAATSETNASNSASSASTSATNASNSASAAATSASNAATSETNAANSATAAAASAALAATYTPSQTGNAGKYLKTDGTNTSWDALDISTANISGTLPIANGGTGTSTAFTAGSVVFAGASGTYSQDNAQLFWDDTNNRLGIGTATPSSNGGLTVSSAGATNYITITAGSISSLVGTDANGLALSALGSNNLILYTSGTERMRINSNGKIGVNGTPQTGASAQVEVLQVLGTDGSTATAAIKRYSNDTSAANLRTYKSRAASVGTDTIVQSGDNIGTWLAYAFDGTAYLPAAQILMSVDGTPGTNDMPGRITFLTTADGASTSTERMRIDSSGNVGIGVTPTLAKLHVYSSISNAQGVYSETTDSGAAFNGVSPTGYVLTGTTGGLTVSDIYSTDASASGMNIYYRKEGGSPVDGDSIALLRFFGEDSALNSQEYGRITTLATDVTSGTEDSELRFSTIAAGAVNSAMRLIDSTQAFIPAVYNSTTASAANVFVASGGLLSRSTSSIQYKTQVEDLAQPNSANIYNMRPVWYRSTCANDNKNWSWYGLIAEEVAELDPRLVHWGYADDQYDITYVENDGQKEEVKTLKENAVMQPEGVQYDRLTVLLIQEIKNLKAELDATKAEVAALKSK